MTDFDLVNCRKISCILEVDREYSKELHNDRNDYPLAPERLIINWVEKITPNPNGKGRYVLHHKALKLYESLGLKIKKIHRGISFKEGPWLKKQIELNTELRANAKNEFEKEFFKFMHNSFLGKTVENTRNKVDVRLVNNRKKASKHAAKQNFKHLTKFDKNLVEIHMKRTQLMFDKPVYHGMSILDISKC